MKFHIRLTHEAALDLTDIHQYVASADDKNQADKLILRLKKQIHSLSTFPVRGNRPPELDPDPASNIHEIHASPFRIIYYILQDTVFILRVLDSRRDLSDILSGIGLQ